MSTPAGILGVWFRGMLSVLFVAGAVTLLANWYDRLPQAEDRTPGEKRPSKERAVLQRIAPWRPGLDEETALLAGGLFLLGLSVAGRFVSPRLLLPAGDPVPELGQGTTLRLVRPDGTQLHVESHGPLDATPVVFTHGWGLNRTEWSYVKQHWGDRFRLVLWDLPGLGKSTQPDNRDFSLEKLAGDLRAVIETTGDKPVVLIGHSIGGMITLTLCEQYPELLEGKVLGAVIVHSTPTNPIRTMQFSGLMTALQKPLIEPLLYLQIWLWPVVWLMNWMGYLNGSSHWSVKQSGFAGGETRSKLDFVVRLETIANPAVIARGALGMLKYDARNGLPSIKIPVLSVAADTDPITLPQASEEIKAGVARGRLGTLSPAKHFGLLEHDQAFAKLAGEFCFETISTRGLTPAPRTEQAPRLARTG